MRDGALRRLVKRVARAEYELGLGLRRALARRRGQPPFELGGGCRRCARCCEEPGIQLGFFTYHVRSLRALVVWWQRVVNGFELTGRDARARLLLFRCTHFDRETRACDSYDSRPGMCRDYPRLLLWQAAPEFLPGCGYRARPPNAERLIRALERVPLDAPRRERLERELGLD